MIARDQIVGVVLAGGRSSRFGSNKALYVHEGQTLLSRAVQMLIPLCGKVYISGECPDYQCLNIECIPDAINGIGPLGGMYSAMLHISSPYYLFVSCDMPYMTSVYAKQLLSISDHVQITFWIDCNQNMQLFPLLISHSLLGAICQKIERGSYNIRSLIHTSISQSFSMSPNDELYFANINYRSDIVC